MRGVARSSFGGKGIKSTARGHDLACLSSSSSLALIISAFMSSVGHAANYTASNEAELRSAIATATADGDPTSTIKLTSNITVTDPTALPAVTKPGLTIDRGTFEVTISNNSLTNNGTITGSTSLGSIETSNFTLINTGNMGAFNGNGGTTIINSGTSDGILFRSGANIYELRAGGSLNPGAALRSFGTDTFRLGGSVDATFDTSLISRGTFPAPLRTYNSFEFFQKVGTSTWTLTGTPASGTVTSWQILEGTLSTSNDANLGAAAGTVTLDGGTLQVTGTSFTSTARTINWGASGGGFDIADPNNTFTLTQSFGGSAGPLSKLGPGTLVLNGNPNYTGATNLLAGTLVVGDPTHPTAGLAGTSVVNVASGATLGGFAPITAPINNNGTIALGNALPAYAGEALGSYRIQGDLTNAGLVQIGGNTLTIAGNVANSGTINLGGSSPGMLLNVVGNVTNSGLINLTGSMPGNSAGIVGNYAGGGGSLLFNTVLNAGGPLSNQFTDRFLITGNATGSTSVNLRTSGGGAYTSIGSPTAATGISLIQVAGSSSPGAFSLPGGYVAAAGTPFQYRLNAYGPGSRFGAANPSQNLVGNPGGYWDFRLQNVYVTPSGDPATPADAGNARLAVVPQVPAYISAPTALFNAGQQDIDQLHRRLGEIRDAQAVGQPKWGEVFARGYGNTMSYHSTRSFTDYGTDAQQSYAAFQIGGSGVVMNDDLGTLRVGVAASYGKLQFDPSAPEGSSEGNLNVGKLYGMATFQAQAGWYLDGIVTGGWFSGPIATTARGQAASLSGSVVGASLEGGLPIALGWQKLTVEPQVQVSWQHLMFDQTSDVDGLTVGLGTLDQGVVRAGARIVRPFETDDGNRVTPYLKVNLLQGFADGGAIDVSGFNFDTGQYGTAIQMGGGVTGMLTAQLAVYGDVSYQHEVSNGGFRGWAFNGGVRYSF
jgi:outer membrane autotransporter protein